ncbi:hypothetical protein TrLO_g13181 [Triparma laevis f. longispina]|uniref:Calmodulin n=2 Tax=Triparma laevis TaxID=1534972 RepID=A0A9W7F890_9STRA|nr:hypothetical protein TrLO_g13181 [Triparma laevis f. longispina]
MNATNPPPVVLHPSMSSTITEVLSLDIDVTFISSALPIHLDEEETTNLESNLSPFTPPTPKITITEISNNDSLICPTRLALSGSTSLEHLYSHPLPTSSYLPSTDSASFDATAHLQHCYNHLLKRARPLIFISCLGPETLLPGKGGIMEPVHNKSSIQSYNPETQEITPLCIGLNTVKGMTCTRSSDIIFLTKIQVTKKGSSALKTYNSTAVKIIAGKDVLDYSLSGDVVPLDKIKTVLILPPSMHEYSNVVSLTETGDILVSVERGMKSGNGGGFDGCVCESTFGGVVVFKGTRVDGEESSSGSSSSLHPFFLNYKIGNEPKPYSKLKFHNDNYVAIITPTIKDMYVNYGNQNSERNVYIATQGLGPECVVSARCCRVDIGRGVYWPLGKGSFECFGTSGREFRSLKKKPGVWGDVEEIEGGEEEEEEEEGWVEEGFVGFGVEGGFKGKKLVGVYGKDSFVARVLRTKAISKIPCPETPRSLPASEAGDEEDDISIESSVDESQHEELFNNLSSALADDEGGDMARRMADLDPSLSTKGPVNVKVVLRCRPLLKGEIKLKIPTCVKCSRNDITVDGEFLPQHADKSFDFDRVFGPETTQKQLYNETVKPIVYRVLDGFKCTVFAYGQTGSGKTYSMEGETGRGGADEAGCIPRAVHTLFDELNEMKGNRYSVTASHMEVYLEQPYDLLATEETGKWKSGSHMKNKLRIVENRLKEESDDSEEEEAEEEVVKVRTGGVEVIGLSEVVVKKPSDVFKIMHRTKQNRHAAETLCNRQSSRSHAVFSINVVNTVRGDGGNLVTRRGKLNLVDLSGSESIKKSGAEGIQAVEASIIGKSLLSLGRVIRSLVSKSSHVPYRESKLTRILSDSLGGSSYTALILAVTPNGEMVGETMSTLSYGMLARDVKNVPKKDVVVKKKCSNGKVEVLGVGEIAELDVDGQLKALEGKIVEEWKDPVAPWGPRVPIRTRKPGETFRGAVNIPVGNLNTTPRVFHNETVEWTREIIDGFGKLSERASACFCEIFGRFDSRGRGELTMDEVQALEFTIGSESATEVAADFLANFKRSFGRKTRNPAVSSTKPGHMTVAAFIAFVEKTASVDPLAVRTMLTKGGYSLSLGKAVLGGEGDGGLETESQQRAKEEMERIKEERNKKTYGANSLKSDKAASKSKVAYEALEKIKAVASKKEGFDLKSAFKKFDIDGNGTVDHEELKQVITDMCETPDDNGNIEKIAKWEMAAIIELFDPNNDGEIDYGEFSWTFYNRRALTNKDAKGEQGEDDFGEGMDTSRGSVGSSSRRRKKKKKKKDPDPIMPPPPKTAGRINIEEALGGLIELTPRDARGVPLALLERRKKQKEEEDAQLEILKKEAMEDAFGLGGGGGLSTVRTAKSGGSGGTSARRPLSALNGGAQTTLPSLKRGASVPGLGSLGGGLGGGGGGGGGEKAKTKPRQEKPAEWQQWVIKSRNTWVNQAKRSNVQVNRAPVDLRGGVQNRSHPKVPLLWGGNK